MEVTITFEDTEAQHVCSNAHGMRMSVAQYLAVTLFNGAGIEPAVVEVDAEPPHHCSSRWEGTGE